MKKHLLILLLFGMISSQAQDSFISVLKDSTEDIPFSIKQIGSNFFLAQRYSLEESGSWRQARISKLNASGKLISTYSYPLLGYLNTGLSLIYPLNNSDFLVIGGCRLENMPFAQLWVMKMDTSLNVIWDKKFMTNQPYTSNKAITENPEGILVIGSALTTGSPSHLYSLFFLEITKDGDSIKSNYLTNGDPSSADIQSFIFISGQYKAFVDGFDAFTTNNCYTQILQLDTSLNLIEVRSTPLWIDSYLTAEKIDNGRYFLTGMAYSSLNHYDITIGKFDTNEDTLLYNHTGSPGAVPDYSAWKQCMTISNNNSIYTGGTTNDNSLFYTCNSNYMKKFMLSNYDSLLNCRWTYFYGCDTACLTLSTIEATSDGGCIMAGMYYNPDYPENMLDVIVIKVDSIGLITGLPDNKTITTHQAIVYPNPGQDYIVIQSGPQIAHSEFRLYNTSGQLVRHTNLNNTNEQSDVSSLPSGVYPWQIIHQGKTIEQGKWVKP
ncbi:MAG: T9SS type A sorting domain-containing protein [Bacteroidales bacterium]|nr:T9SS type A sorting domain-containing protein [Bacteroidales bacterium]MBK9355949.1 T9SS type A sorting domain-containing protein [Bacteroidales bacterium]